MPPDRKNGTSAPIVAPTSRSSVIGAPPHSRPSAISAAARVGAAAAEPCLDGIFLSIWITASQMSAAAPERRPQRRRRLPHQVARVERHAGRAAVERERPRTLGAHQRVVQLDRLKDGPQLVIAVGADAEHAQIEVDFGVRADNQLEAFGHR